tara:strand:- start:620 stop:1243 length:624 start_codon:yes stop_codon:yes gene_type:complete
MKVKTIIEPVYENGDYLLELSGVPDYSKVKNIEGVDFDYLHFKYLKFLNIDTRVEGWDQFKSRPSLRSLDSMNGELSSTVYTNAVSKNNEKISYESSKNMIKSMLEKNPATRRAFLRFASPISEYYVSTYSPIDVTCLSAIHYLNDSCKLLFRASDIKNELLYDIITIDTFFLKPIYGEQDYSIKIYASTAQNVEYWEDTMKILGRI